MKWYGAKILNTVNLRLRVLHRKKIVIAIVWVDPQIWGDHLVRRKGSDDIRQYLFFSQPQFRRMQSINVDAQRRIVEILRNEDVSHSGIAAKLRCDGLRCFVVLG